jgi:hypothetical protein
LDDLTQRLADEATTALVVVDPLADPSERGLDKPQVTAANVVTLFSAQPETVQNPDAESSFAQAFATHVVESGADFATWLDEVRSDVAEETENTQTPYFVAGTPDAVLVTDASTCAAYLKDRIAADDLVWTDVTAAVDVCTAAAATASDDSAIQELLAQAQERAAAKDAFAAEDPVSYAQYLSRFSDGEYAEDVREALADLGADGSGDDAAGFGYEADQPGSADDSSEFDLADIAVDEPDEVQPEGRGGESPFVVDPTGGGVDIGGAYGDAAAGGFDETIENPGDANTGSPPPEPGAPETEPTPAPPPPPPPAPATDPIAISSPDLSRGPMRITGGAVDIAGTLQWNETILTVLVGTQKATLGPNGTFSAHVTVPPGATSVTIVAVSTTGDTLTKTLEIAASDEPAAAMAGPGRRYAVIIANQDYAASSGFVTLKTPLNDAEELMSVLKSQYGFSTDITDPGGKPASLFLKDATARDIGMALYYLSKVANDNDTVAIYYAGHGVLDADKAYWVPTDASAGVWPSYISAAAISDAIEHIKARKLILISDSCFSGALMRGGPADDIKIDATDRAKALARIGSDRSRILISSGNNEPVSDAGGNGHSVFAQALLNGLARMPDNQFTAHELFDYIVTAVTANSKQEPQFRPLDDVGHEGGDVIFERAAG